MISFHRQMKELNVWCTTETWTPYLCNNEDDSSFSYHKNDKLGKFSLLSLLHISARYFQERNHNQKLPIFRQRNKNIPLSLRSDHTVSRFKNWKLAVQSKLGPPSTKLGWPSTYIQYCAGVPLWIRNYNSWNGGSIQNTWTASLMVYFSLNSRVS